jgi:hypothetical protein
MPEVRSEKPGPHFILHLEPIWPKWLKLAPCSDRRDGCQMAVTTEGPDLGDRIRESVGTIQVCSHVVANTD